MSLSIGGYSSGAAQAKLAQLFTKMDADQDGKVSRSEFVGAAPEGVSGTAADALFTALDSADSGALSESDFSSAFSQLAGETRGALISLQQAEGGAGGPPPPPPPGGGRGGPDASEMFASMDTDGDGTVTREEAVAARPDDVSEEQATAFFDAIAGGADSLTEDAFADGLKAMEGSRGPGGPGGPGGPPPASASADEEEDTLAALLDSVTTDSGATDTTTADTEAASRLKVLLETIASALNSYQNSATASTESSLASTLSLAA